MKHNRRQFIRQTASLGLGLGAIQYLHAGLLSEPLPPFSDDEFFWKQIRSQFPLTDKKVFLNNGTMGPSPYPVIYAVQQDMLNVDSQAHYGGGEEEATAALGRFLGCDAEEMSLTHNVTEGINIVCWGLDLKQGDEVIVTNHEHVGSAGPWINRVKLSGIVLKVISPGKDAQETLENVKKAISTKTKLIALPHIPCTIGQIFPVKEICSIAREKGITTFLDGAHPPGMLQVNLHDIGCDFYAGCCHKWMLGPKGSGFLYVSKTKRDMLQTYYMGGGTISSWDIYSNPPTLSNYSDNGHRYYYGTQNSSLYKGIVAAIEFQEQIGQAQIEKRIKTLSGYLQEQLIKLDKRVKMLTPSEEISRGAQIGFKVEGKNTNDLYNHIMLQGITIRYVGENNLDNIRVSTHIYNSHSDIDQFLKVLGEYLLKS